MEQIVDIEIEERGDLVLARVEGEVDISNIAEVRRRLTACVPNSALGLVLDLSPTSYLDSSGVHLLYELTTALKRHRQAIRVVAPEETASGRVLLLTGMDKVIPMSDTVAQAAQAMVGAHRVGAGPSPS